MTTETSQRNKAAVRALYEDCINEGRLERLPELIADDYVGPTGERGPGAFAKTAAILRSGMPDVRFTVEDLIADGDRVVVRWSWKGTHTGVFRGYAPTKKSITDTGIAIYRLRDGKAVEAWLETDRLGVLQQVGAVEPGIGAPRPDAEARSGVR